MALSILSENGLARAKELLAEGKTYGMVGQIMSNEGYRSTSGDVISSNHISKLMVDNGVRRKNVKTKAKKKEEPKPDVVADQPKSNQIGRGEAARAVIAIKGMSAEERLAIVDLILEGSK